MIKRVVQRTIVLIFFLHVPNVASGSSYGEAPQAAGAAPIYDSPFYDDDERARSIFPELGHPKYRKIFLEEPGYEELLDEFDRSDDEPNNNYERSDVTSDPATSDESAEGGYDLRRMDKVFMSTLKTCNANITSAACASWSDFVASQEDASTAEIKIPCGTCVTLDVTAPGNPLTTIRLPHGLNIVGKLHIPEHAKVEIITPFVLVQGILRVDPPATGTTIPRGDAAKVTITLTGETDISFKPDEETGNGMQCMTPCNVGSKVVAVAGGTLDVNAIDERCPTWTKLSTLSADKRVVTLTDGAASRCWGAGAEILFTPEDSAAVFWETAVVASTDPSLGTITLVEPLVKRKTSVADGYGAILAVEVALLERNVVIRPDDTLSLIGGHVIIYHSPSIPQKLEGVELYKMGQQGNIGRYPLHYHMSEDCEGSLISKNLVRASNQRCIVMHGTHKVTISDNVAFDTFGHCYMTEDGAEWSNVFRNNLGAYTRRPAKLIRSTESDNFPATFWITQPSTHLIGNVAAGSESSGFWLEAKGRLPGMGLAINVGVTPRFVALGSFVNNTSHSNNGNGIALYPIGYVPRVGRKSKQAVLKNVVTFKNTGNGVFLHSSENIKIEGGYFGDNKISMRNFRVPKVVVEDVTVVGTSDNMRQLMAEGRIRDIWCWGNGERVGITFNPNAPGDQQIVLNRVSFHNFDDAGPKCSDAHALFMESEQVREGIYNGQVKFSGVTFTNTSEEHRVDVCRSMNTPPKDEGPVTNIAIEDHEGAFTGVPGFLVQENDSALRTFLPDGGDSCRLMAGGCLYFCPDACLQLATVVINPNVKYAKYRMSITDDSGNVDYKIRQVHKEWNDNFNENAFIGVALPGHSSTYRMSFVDEHDNPAWPGFVKSISYGRRPMNCATPHFQDSAIIWDYPAPGVRCNSLMNNGDFELGSILGWQGSKTPKLEMMQPGADGSQWALQTGDRNSKWATVRYFFDPSCFRSWGGEVVRLSGKIRTRTNKGDDVTCVSGSQCAPKLNFELKTQSASLIASVVATSIGTVAGEWTHFETEVTLPANLQEVGQVGIMFWDASKYRFLLDDWNIVHIKGENAPSEQPTEESRVQPSGKPTGESTNRSSGKPSGGPTGESTVQISEQPSGKSSEEPTASPTASPTAAKMSSSPTFSLSSFPSGTPTAFPSAKQSGAPSSATSDVPSGSSSAVPSGAPSSSPSAEMSPSPTDLLSSVPSLKDLCANLKKKQCNTKCVWGPKKVKACLVKKEIFEHDCAQYTKKSLCKEEKYCKFVDRRCFHNCDGLAKKKCIKAQHCKPAKIANPCFGCQLVTTCGPIR